MEKKRRKCAKLYSVSSSKNTELYILSRRILLTGTSMSNIRDSGSLRVELPRTISLFWEQSSSVSYKN